MCPLTSREIPRLDLLRALNQGLLPAHYLAGDARRTLKSYVQDYLKEEILAEGLTRNMPAFFRFMDALAFSQGELTNYANIARDCGVDGKTVKGYFEILVDTLLGVFVEPYARKSGRDAISATPKFYLFDVGVAGHLARRALSALRGPEFGRAFEHFILMELLAHRGYGELDHPIRFWRTKAGYEVDFVLGEGEVAIEVKGTDRVDGVALRPLKAFCDEAKPRKAFVVCNEARRRQVNGVVVLPWAEFLDELWGGGVL
jgi:predicted AAA+ superfamily ATPase